MSKYGFLDQIRVIQMETRAPDSAVSDADQAKIGITYVSALSLLIYATGPFLLTQLATSSSSRRSERIPS